jgi:hypothetical protein
MAAETTTLFFGHGSLTRKLLTIRAPTCVSLQSGCALLLLPGGRVLLRPIHHIRQLEDRSDVTIFVQKRLQLRVKL